MTKESDEDEESDDGNDNDDDDMAQNEDKEQGPAEAKKAKLDEVAENSDDNADKTESESHNKEDIVVDQQIDLATCNSVGPTLNETADVPTLNAAEEMENNLQKDGCISLEDKLKETQQVNESVD